MYSYEWDEETGGLLLQSSPLQFSKEPRPVYYKELDLLGFDQYWNYDKNDAYPYMWAESNNYFYRGRKVAMTKGGSCFTAPEIVILEEPEPAGQKLRFVDVQAMVEKNKILLESLAQETIRKVFNIYAEYKNRVDIFHVSYSGGKDSEVTLDIVQRALPHNAFIVLFGNTGMEFHDTYDAVEKIKRICEDRQIDFYIASANISPLETWEKFGYPSSSLRWCCGVHKTAPQLLKLREVTGKNNVKEMSFVGVRSSESVRRSGYDYLSMGTKHGGQYSFNPILEWNSAEVYLYIYMEKLHLNDAYKKGSSRAGCLFCPMATEKSDYINRKLYPESVEPFLKIIKNMYVNGQTDSNLMNSYIENKGWKARKNGRDIINGFSDFIENTVKDKRIITVRNNSSWKEWIKTIGEFDQENGNYRVTIRRELTFYFQVKSRKDGYSEFVFDENTAKSHPTDFKNIKNILKKSHSCISCKYCSANCPYGNIQFVDGKISVSDACIKCGLCNKIDNGCLVFNSLMLPKGNGKMRKGSIDEYGTHPVKLEWIKEFIKYKEEFDVKHTLGSAMLPMFKKFLRNAEIISTDNGWNGMTKLLFRDELDAEYIWALMFANLAYSSQFGWLIKNLKFGITYSQNEMKDVLSSFITSKTGPANIANSYRRIAELPFSKIGFGQVVGKNTEGFLFMRNVWSNPDPRVVLYSLYKFAEACGDYYQFTLTRLLNHDIESDGISPTEIFGLDREQMEKILNGLTINYPEYINATFTLDLDNINLMSDKTSTDVLTLF